MMTINQTAISIGCKIALSSALISLSAMSLMPPQCFAETKKTPSWYPDNSYAQQYESIEKSVHHKQVPYQEFSNAYKKS